MSISKSGETPSTTRLALGAILVLHIAVSVIGITWGLPSRKIDKFLFGDGEVWSGEKIYRLAKADAKFSQTRGADVDVDPIRKGGDEPIPLTATDEDVARIYLRYRLYTYQPDEMITMMALAGMRPGKLDLDPRLYQYGGLFIYPVGALIKLCGILGLIDVRGDLVFYLDNPDEFAKFYIVARAYSAAWGLLGVIVVYSIAKRIVSIRTPSASAGSTGGPIQTSGAGPVEPPPSPRGDQRGCPPVACALGSDASHRAGLLAALLFTLMPVVVCMSHEGKPHLPGAVLMLLAVYFAMRSTTTAIRTPSASAGSTTSSIRTLNAGAEEPPPSPRGDQGGCGKVDDTPIYNRQFFWLMCISCGAALGMVLSSWPILVLIPLIAFTAANVSERTVTRFPRDRATRMLGGTAVALCIYFITNPYVLINAFVNREVLQSNFGNSLAMYQIARIGEGFTRVIELTIEGATLPIVVFGLIAFIVAVIRKNRAALPLIVVAALFFLQFVLIGAGKPAEYGRFGLFTNSALAIGTSCVLGCRKPGPLRPVAWAATAAVTMWIGWCGFAYLFGFTSDAGGNGTRMNLARFCTHLQRDASTGRIVAPLATFAEPAPYCYPPIDFAHADLHLVNADSYTGHLDREAFAFAPIENAYKMFPKYAEGMAFAPILRTARFVDDPSLSTMMLGVDSAWRSTPTGLGEFGRTWRRRFARNETPISWANKPFFDSVFHYLSNEQLVPLGR